MRFSIYRYNPQTDEHPYMQDYVLASTEITPGMMLLQAMLKLKEQDETLSFRRSCGEGVCGSDGLNINGTNGLACTTALATLREPVVLRPLPGMPVIRDLVVDMENFYTQYHRIKPWLTVHDPEPEVEYLQSPAQRAQLDGLYECILCACCSTSCPSYWWNPDKFLGPAALLQAYRFVCDSRDQISEARLEDLEGPYKLFRCHTILNCVNVCPKKLNPAVAIGRLKRKMMEQTL